MRYLRVFAVVLLTILVLEWLNPEWTFKNFIPSYRHSSQYNVFTLSIVIIFAALIIRLLTKRIYRIREPWTVFSVIIKAILVIILFFALGHFCSFMTETFKIIFQHSYHPEEIKSLYIIVAILTGIVAVIRILL